MKSIIQTRFFNFDSSNAFSTIPDTLYTSTQGTNFTYNPFYSCRTRRGYGLRNDPFNNWKLQEEVNHYSRGDLKRAYRIGGGF